MGKRNHTVRIVSRVVLRRGTIPAAYGLPHLHTAAQSRRMYTTRSVLLCTIVPPSRSPPLSLALVHTYLHTHKRWLPLPSPLPGITSLASTVSARLANLCLRTLLIFVPSSPGVKLRRTIVSQRSILVAFDMDASKNPLKTRNTHDGKASMRDQARRRGDLENEERRMHGVRAWVTSCRVIVLTSSPTWCDTTRNERGRRRNVNVCRRRSVP